MTSLIRTRWAAIGAAAAVSLGAGGLLTANAASDPSVLVAISPTRVLDTRIDVGLTAPLVTGQARTLDVTGTIPIVGPGDVATAGSPVPDGATAIVANVTGILPSALGFLAVRPGDATGDPTTSSLNFPESGVVVPNSVTVEIPTTGAAAGTINLFYFGNVPASTVDVAIDIVGYYQAGGSGVPGPKGDTGPKGDKGDQGDPGSTGPRGFSAWDTIPSGVTVTGGFVYDEALVADNALHFELVEFPGRAPAAPSAINFAADTDADTTDDDATCTGSTADPTAPPGQVCDCLSGNGNTDGIDARPSTGAGIPAPYGFQIRFIENGAPGSDLYLYATWAYTAP